MKRKTFILSIFGALGAFTLPSWLYFRTGYKALVIPEMLSAISTPQMISEIGAAYLKQHPGEGDSEKLSCLILATADGNSISVRRNALSIRSFIKNKIREDFLHHRLRVIDGWVLSHTEARQCALHYLKKS